MKKILTLPALLLTVLMSATPVGEKKARELAASFFGGTTRSVVENVGLELAEGVNAEQNVYVFNRQGGGFAIIAGDDRFTPVIAYSYDGTFDKDNMPPAARHLIDCWARQIASGYVHTAAAAGSAGVGNVVRKYDTPSWGQGEPYNLMAPVISNQTCVTGCVATAMAMVLYHNRWPASGSGTVPPYSYNYGTTYTMPAYTFGKTYDYSSMLMDYSGSYTPTQATAIAQLMRDMGAAVNMAYTPSASSSSGRDIAKALSDYFSYSKSASLVAADLYDDRGWVEALQANLTKCGPTIVNGSGAEGGHAFIVDGYTDRGYFSVNFGWGGYSNGYFLMPSLDFNVGQGAVFDLVPDKNGSTAYEDNLGLISLYDNSGQPVYKGLSISASELTPGSTYSCKVGGLINNGQADFNGTFIIAVCDREGNIRQNLMNEVKLSLKPSYYIAHQYSIKLPATFEDGDRIRLMCKGDYSNNGWNWVRKSDAGVDDQILLSANPSEIAEAVGLKYSKTAKTITLSSKISVRYTLADSKSSQVVSGTVGRLQESTIDVSACPSGDYILSMSCGGQPYQLKLVL